VGTILVGICGVLVCHGGDALRVVRLVCAKRKEC
jgi:hypothetical protein